MQKNQQLIVVIYALVCFLMVVCPPWNCVNRSTNITVSMGYGPFWQPPAEKEKLAGSQTPGNPVQPYVAGYTANEVDVFRLVMQIVLLSITCAVAYPLVHQKPRHRPNPAASRI